jgi:leucyl-tRNA synthetase
MVLAKTYRDRQTGKPIAEANVTPEKESEIEITWEKMSKSKFNGVSPIEIISEYGADTARLFILFKAPPDIALNWDTNQIKGPSRWLSRLCDLTKHFMQNSKYQFGNSDTSTLSLHYPPNDPLTQSDRDLLIEVKNAIESVTLAMESRPPTLNVAVSSLMKLSNVMKENEKRYMFGFGRVAGS